MTIDYYMINRYLENPQRAWSKVDKGVFSAETISFFSEYDNLWCQCIKEGLLDVSQSAQIRIELIARLQSMVDNRGCLLYQHLEKWKLKLIENVSDSGADHDAVEDSMMIRNVLAEL